MSESDEAEPRGLDLPRLFGLTVAHKWWLILPTAAAFVGAGAFVAVVKPHYTATARVMLANGDSYYTRPDKAPPDAAVTIDETTVASEAEAAKSPDVERNAMAKLKPEDLEDLSSGGLFARTSGADAQARKLEAFARKIDVYPQAKTRVLLFDYTASDRGRAARGAEALAEAFLESQRSAKDEEAKSASRWLSQQIEALQVKVADAESKVEALRGQAGLLTGVSGIAVPSQQLSEIAGQIASARAAEATASAKAAGLRNLLRSGHLDDVASVANDESLRRYADTRVTLRAQIAELGRTMLPGHPRMKELEAQVASLDAQIRDAAMKRVHGFEEEARISQAQVKSLRLAVTDQAKTVSSSDADQAKLRGLEIDAKTWRDQLESYLTKYREAIARDAANAAPANGRIIAHALAPLSPSFPKAGPTLLLAPLAAFFVSLGLVVAKILLTDGGAPAAPARAASSRREPSLPFGIDPPVAPEPAAFADETVWAAQVDRFLDRLADTSDGESLPLLVVGEGSTGVLPVALAAARYLSRRGPTALVDLGASPSWLPDLFDREGPPRALLPLADLAADPRLILEAAERDLSTSLHIFPSQAPAVGDLRELWEALAHNYAFVVAHAPDWRDEACVNAVEDMAALLVVAPSPDLSALEARVRAAFRAEGVAIKGIDTAERGQVRAA
jgi:succinoglycan biosynthesis transport protein ExoP